MLAMGVHHSVLGVPGENEYVGRGVSYCATCDGAFYRNRSTAVVGGGDVAVEDAIYLAGMCKHVTLIHRRDSLRAVKTLQDKLLSMENVNVAWNSTVTSIQGGDMVDAISLHNVVTGETTDLGVDGVFIAVGMVPETSLIKGLPKLDEKGYIAAGEDCKTSIPGIYAVGDIRTKQLRQVITAVADGANAVTSAEKYLLEGK